jgi:hypothetical protein
VDLYLHFSIHLHDMELKTTRENFSVTEWLDNLLSLKCDSELILHNCHSTIKYGHHVQAANNIYCQERRCDSETRDVTDLLIKKSIHK